jgi:hypothetical protein
MQRGDLRTIRGGCEVAHNEDQGSIEVISRSHLYKCVVRHTISIGSSHPFPKFVTSENAFPGRKCGSSHRFPKPVTSKG